ESFEQRAAGRLECPVERGMGASKVPYVGEPETGDYAAEIQLSVGEVFPGVRVVVVVDGQDHGRVSLSLGVQVAQEVEPGARRRAGDSGILEREPRSLYRAAGQARREALSHPRVADDEDLRLESRRRRRTMSEIPQHGLERAGGRFGLEERGIEPRAEYGCL